MKFEKNALRHYKDPSRGAKLCCQLCKAGSTNSLAAAKVRQTNLLSILRQPDAYKCTCKRIPRGQKAYHALNNRIHSERCGLFPKSMGEKMWDGKNKGITLVDLRFLLDRKAY